MHVVQIMLLKKGAKTCDIYIPWHGFNGSTSELLPSWRSYNIAEKYHPRWDYLNQGGQKLMARNVHQVLGTDLNTPSEFVICWTPNGSGSGGTGQALRLAKDYNIPVFDCGIYKIAGDAIEPLKKFILKMVNK